MSGESAAITVALPGRWCIPRCAGGGRSGPARSAEPGSCWQDYSTGEDCHAQAGPLQPGSGDAPWRKSSHSVSDGDCVEVAHLPVSRLPCWRTRWRVLTLSRCPPGPPWRARSEAN
ncbi:DUF397 domain-containing protein [Streptomyces sp. NPDC057543]|uniref:DUF397 domain-containing protein n=1 Tax=Streptomyces sp. NPDC057543 TaxID=3346163 RepID=UPI0036B64EB5